MEEGKRVMTHPDDKVHVGLTKREYFAAIIYAGLTYKDTGSFEMDANAAVGAADALIARLNL